MQPNQISDLLTAYSNGTITDADYHRLQQVLLDDRAAADCKIALEQLLQAELPDPSYDPSKWNATVHTIVSIDKPGLVAPPADKLVTTSHRVQFLKTSWFRYAAILVVLLALGVAVRTLYQTQKRNDIARRIEKSRNNDAPPGGDKAMLTLADGTKILLDSAANGQLASRGNVQIIKLQNGQLKFVISQAGAAGDAAAVQMNTITTPRGGQYQLELPDGTHIWLNAATSLRFPTAFTGSKRPVQLDGEAYFEVAKDAAQPFEVAANATTVTVLGTHFNVNAYPDEQATTTTLLEGKVQVQSGGNTAELLPGYQCHSGNGSNSLNAHANTEEAVAWKNGQFQFTGADIQSILRQISRWYGVEIHYEQDIPSAHLTGEIPRTLTLRQVLQVLNESGVRIWLEDNQQLYVMPAL